MSGRLVRYLPLLLFVVLGLLFGVQLFDNRGSTLRSALIDRPAPEFVLPTLGEGAETVTQDILASGKVSIVNMWASWCAPCRLEHPELMRLAAERPDVQLIGYNYRDQPGPAQRFLDELGDPYDRILVDVDGREALRWGLTGVPETFIISGEGRIIYKHVGPILRSEIENPCTSSTDRFLRTIGLSSCEIPRNDMADFIIPAIKIAGE
ncbi:MAG: DsbE family thiol:disulfide interchange protein [Pseudomonadota bacterium]